MPMLIAPELTFGIAQRAAPPLGALVAAPRRGQGPRQSAVAPGSAAGRALAGAGPHTTANSLAETALLPPWPGGDAGRGTGQQPWQNDMQRLRAALWLQAHSVFEQLRERSWQLMHAISTADAARAASYGGFMGYAMPFRTATHAARETQRQREQKPITQQLWPVYGELMPLQASLCPSHAECGITLEPLHVLQQPVAACHRGALQVYEFEALQMYWRAYPGRGNSTPSHMPISRLYRIVAVGPAPD